MPFAEVDQLTALFQEGLDDLVSDTFRGVAFELETHGPTLLSDFGQRLVGWLIGRRPGRYLTVRLPARLGLDLYLQSGSGPGSAPRFQWSCTNTERFAQIFDDKAMQTLGLLNKQLRVVITDEWLELGPVAREPSQASALLARAVELANRLSANRPHDPTPASIDANEEPPLPTGPAQLLLRCTRPVEINQLQAKLREAGLSPRVRGTRSTVLMAAAPHIFYLRLEVPESQLAWARAIQASQGQAASCGQARPLTSFARTIAFGMAFVLPGGSHQYVLRPWTALPLALFWLAGLLRCFPATWIPLTGFWGESDLPTGLAWLICAVVLDALGGQRAFSDLRLGRRTLRGFQLVHGTIYAFLCWLAGQIVRVL